MTDPWAEFTPAAPAGDPWAEFKPVEMAAPAPVGAIPAGDGSAAVGQGLVSGVPILGPYLAGGLTNVAAGVRSLQGGTPFADEKRNVEAFNQDLRTANPGATAGGELAGAVLGTAPAVMAAPAAFGAGTGALAARVGASALTGGAIGAADAGARGQDPLIGGLVGGTFGAAAPYVGAGLGKIAGGVANRLNPPPAAPTIPELKAGATAAYQAAKDAGVQIAQPSFGRAVQDIGMAAREAGIDKTLHPKASAVLSRFAEAAETAPSLGEVEILRRVAKGASGSIEPDERRIGKLIVGKLDNYVGGLKEGDLIAGDAKQAVEALSEARGLWARARKSEMLAEAIEKADLRAASTGSGGNVENAIRQNVRGLLTGKNARSFSADERAAMEAVVRGTGPQNAARLVGKLSPSGNGLMAALGIGATAANPMMAAAPMAGMAAKAFADRGTKRNVDLLAQLVANGGKVPEAQAAITAREKARLIGSLLLAPTPPVANQQRAR